MGESMTLNELATMLKQERERQEISQRQLGEATGYHQNTIQNAERGEASLTVYQNIANALGYQVMEDYHLIKLPTTK